MLAKIKNLATQPPGTIPKRLQTVVLVGITAVIVVSGFCSRQRVASKTAESALAPLKAPLADAYGIRSIRDDIEEKLRKLELQRQQLQQAEGTPVVSRAEAPRVIERRVEVPVPTAPVDPSEAEAHKREIASVFAPIVAFRLASESQSQLPAARSEQSVVAPVAPQPTPVPTTTAPRESGRLLRPREGGLFRLYEGTPMQAALLNKLDGSFDGPVICGVTAPVYSKDGLSLLIPTGSKLVGEAKHVELSGQKRLSVMFHRLLLPNGYSVDLDKLQALSAEGETGLKGNVNNHSIQRFLLAGARGLLGALSLRGTGSVIGSDAGDRYRQEVASKLGESGTQSLEKYVNVVPTITIPEGHPVQVILNSDLLLPEYGS